MPQSGDSVLVRVTKFCLRHFLVLGLVVVLSLGMTVPQLGSWAASARVGEWGVVKTIAICIIFLISGLTLRTDDVIGALKEWPALLFGIVSILFITPLLALVPMRLTFMPKEFRYGLLLFCSMPTTINSGVALACVAGGSFSLALLLTVSSNLIGIFTVPFFLSLLLSIGRVHIDAALLTVKLMLTILLPLSIGKALRELSPRLRAALALHKQLAGNVSSFCLLLIPWMELSVSQQKLLTLDAGALLGLLLCGLVLHLIYLAFNFAVARYILRLRLELRKSVVIMASQKALSISMTVLSFFPATLGERGLIAIPCITSHIVQLLADAFIAGRWSQMTDPAIRPAAAVTSMSK